MKTWFTIKAQADGKPAEISIHDAIGGWNVNARDFLAQLNAIDAKDITLTINSPGGSVVDGIAIYNGLKNHPANVTVKVLGIAASIASVVAMAGDKIIMPENAFMMVHSPGNIMIGNAADMRDMADLLDKIESSLISTYVARTGKTAEEIKALLDAETFMTAAEAVKMGFADEMEPALKITASFDLENLPENIRNVFNAAKPAEKIKCKECGAEMSPKAATCPKCGQPNPQSKPMPSAETSKTFAAEVNALAIAAGLGDYVAAWLLDASLTTIDQAKAAISEATEVLALCQYAKVPDLAAKMIESRTTLKDARAELCARRAAITDANRVDSTQPANKQQSTNQGGLAVWAKIFPPATSKK